MRRHTDVSNSADIIDSRDVIARISELEGELEDRHETEKQDALDAAFKKPLDAAAEACAGLVPSNRFATRLGG